MKIRAIARNQNFKVSSVFTNPEDLTCFINENSSNFIEIQDLSEESPQLTKREQFAMAAMQAIIGTGDCYKGFISDSVAYAEALLKELEK